MVFCKGTAETSVNILRDNRDPQPCLASHLFEKSDKSLHLVLKRRERERKNKTKQNKTGNLG